MATLADRTAAVLACGVAWYAVLHTTCAASPGLEGPVEARVPVVVHLDAWKPPSVSDAEALAARILRREGSGSSLDEGVRHELSREIDGVLSLIRDQYPETADVVARETYERRKGVILGLDPELLASVSRIAGRGPGPFALRTGHVRFDALNASLGVRAVKVIPLFEDVVFHFDPTVDLAYVASRYAALEQVRSVTLDSLLIDGPDIEVSRSQGKRASYRISRYRGDDGLRTTWYFVFRDAWGDCPSGCISVDLHFFTVQDGDVKGIDPARAMDVPEFAAICENRGWFRRGRPRNST